MRWLGPPLLPLAVAGSCGRRQAARSSSQPLLSCRLREVLKGAPDLWCRAAVCLRRTCGRDRRSGAGPAAELRRHVHDDGGMTARSRPTRPASPTSDLRRSRILISKQVKAYKIQRLKELLMNLGTSFYASIMSRL